MRPACSKFFCDKKSYSSRRGQSLSVFWLEIDKHLQLGGEKNKPGYIFPLKGCACMCYFCPTDVVGLLMKTEQRLGHKSLKGPLENYTILSLKKKMGSYSSLCHFLSFFCIHFPVDMEIVPSQAPPGAETLVRLVGSVTLSQQQLMYFEVGYCRQCGSQ